MARRAKGFGMDILYHNRTRKMDAEKEFGAQNRESENLIMNSDYVVSLAPLTPETSNLFKCHLH